ncbi:hypothetical protein RJ639_034070 [Escallonia herrerae]|uniref:Retrotransposon gag domain-containing protein n=1 Tax=Escallonia herrerae TaxID=1293975 RepID=A0AA88X175_9ASTE|nr:hypothetical protein RJ639_034070 [Escallonia herrerae]
MAVVPPPTYHSHLDPGDLCLRLTSRSSYGRKYQSTADPTYNHKDKSRDHVTRSGSCYRRDSSVEDSTNSSPAQAARVKTPRRPIHRKRMPESRSQERDSWKVVPRYHSPERSRPRNESGYPLSKAIEKAKLPPNFRMPQCDLYDGTGDPGEHVYQFQTNMLLLQVSDAVMCRAFPTTLRKAAHAWFKSIQPRSIHSFSQLSDLFQKHFAVANSSRDQRQQGPPVARQNEIPTKQEEQRSVVSLSNDHGHTTDNCGSLKRAIEALIKRGQLRKFVAPKEDKQQTPPAIEEREDREENAGIINTISGGLAAGGSSGRARKAYAKEVYITSQPPDKKSKTVPVAAITFSDEDSKHIQTPHDDPLVITVRAGNFDVKRVLIDNGSSAEILFFDAFKKMNIPTDRLRKMDTPLYGFSNHPVAAEGIIALPVAIGTPPAQANFILDFVVVKVPSAYNAILGRPALNQLQVVVSTYHLKMKFPTEHEIGEAKGDQTIARQCYVTSCRPKKAKKLDSEEILV